MYCRCCGKVCELWRLWLYLLNFFLQEEVLAQPSKLWMTWLYRDLATEPKWTKERVEKIFGKDYKVPKLTFSPKTQFQVGRAEVLKNTEAVNQELWHIKHLIELKPISFPDGEPTNDDLHGIRLDADGICRVVKDAPEVTETDLRLTDGKKQVGFLESLAKPNFSGLRSSSVNSWTRNTTAIRTSSRPTSTPRPITSR